MEGEATGQVDDCESFLDSLINLTAASHKLPPAVQQEFLSLDPSYRLQAQYESEKTLALLRFLLGYVLPNEPSMDPCLIDNDVDDAIDELLSDGFDFLDKEPVVNKRTPSVQRRVVRGIDVVYSNNIQRPARFMPRSDPMPRLQKRVGPFPDFNLKLPDLMDPNRVTVVSDPGSLERICMLIRASGCVFVTVEQHRIHTYRPFPCLVNLFFGERLYLVDALAIRSNCQCLRNVFIDTGIVKVLFDATAMLELLWETLGIAANSVYDPLAAFRMMDLNGGYQDILRHFHEEPTPVLIDWRIRPLTTRMIQAAAYKLWKLPKLARRSQKDLTLPPGILVQIMNEEITYQFEPYTFTEKRANEIAEQIASRFDLSSIQKQIALKLIKWRDMTAQLEDECPNMVLCDSAIAALAAHRPRTVAQFDSMRIPKTPITISYGAEILSAIAQCKL